MKLIPLKIYLELLLQLGWRLEQKRNHIMGFHPNGRAKVLIDRNDRNFAKQGFYKQLNHLRRQGVVEELLRLV